jgi:hypothetical protein
MRSHSSFSEEPWAHTRALNELAQEELRQGAEEDRSFQPFDMEETADIVLPIDHPVFGRKPLSVHDFADALPRTETVSVRKHRK